MRVYLKNGKSLRISQKVANELTEMIIADGKNLLIQKHIISKNVWLLIKIDEIAAIK